MFNFLNTNPKISLLEKKIACLEKKVASLEKALKYTSDESDSVKTKSKTKSKTKAKAALTPQEEKEKKAAERYQKRVKETIAAVMEITGWDYEYTEKRYTETHERIQCTPKEFVLYKLYELTDEQQDTFYLARYQKVLQKKYNKNQEFTKMLYDKERTNLYFSEFVRRPWCANNHATFEEFKETFKNSNRVIYKPSAGHRGYGIEAFSINSDNIKEVYDKVVTYPAGVVEEFIVQHKDMSSLSPASVNSLRFVTLSSKKPITKDGKKMAIVYSIVRIGRGESIVDNLHSGGMVANVDMENGTLATHGADRSGNLFHAHPETNVVIKGFKIPYFEESLEMVKTAIEKYNVEGYIGWDIAISENGPMLLEVNDRPGSDGLQTAYAQEGIGMKHVMEKYL